MKFRGVEDVKWPINAAQQIVSFNNSTFYLET